MFYGCDKISQLNYTGTLSEWSSIAIGSHNQPITNLAPQCSI